MKENPKDCLNCKKPVCDDCKDIYKGRKDYYKDYYRRNKKREKINANNR